MRTQLFFVCACHLFLTSCSLRFPTVAEEQKLVSDGAFPAGVPGWVPRAVGTSTGADMNREQGVIPTSFSQAESSQSKPTAIDYRVATRKKAEKQAAQQAEPLKEGDFIGKVLSDCPNVEKNLTKALTEINQGKRVSMYERLTAVCPRSGELWFWLGQAYKGDGKLVAARGAFERAQVLSPDNRQVDAELQNLRSAAQPSEQ